MENYRINSFRSIYIKELDIFDYHQINYFTNYKHFENTHGLLNEDYIKEKANEADGGWVIYAIKKSLKERLKGNPNYEEKGEDSSSDEESPEKLILGFLLFSTLDQLNEYGEDEFNIDVICVNSILSGYGYGNQLMKKAFDFCKDNDIIICTLQALEQNDTYFEKYGFEKDNNMLNEEKLWDMTKIIE